ncbi:MAG: hypothetical protein AAF721_39430 [Myxococcota bacterium]
MIVAALAAVVGLSEPPTQPLGVTVVAPRSEGEAIAAALAPRLEEVGFAAVDFTRCPDFGCVAGPGAPAAIEVIVLAGHADTAVVIVRTSTSTSTSTRTSTDADTIVERLDVEDPLSAVDHEALGFAVTRALSAPPERLRTTWADAERVGRAYAPPPESAVSPPAAVERAPRAAAYGRGPYLDLAVGAATSMRSGFHYAPAVGLASGFMFARSAAPGLRLRVGARAWGAGAADGIAAAEARAGIGWAGERVLLLGHLGLGPAVVYGESYGGVAFTGLASAAGSIRGRFGKRGSYGIEAGVALDVVDLSPYVHALFLFSWTWGR